MCTSNSDIKIEYEDEYDYDEYENVFSMSGNSTIDPTTSTIHPNSTTEYDDDDDEYEFEGMSFGYGIAAGVGACLLIGIIFVVGKILFLPKPMTSFELKTYHIDNEVAV